jgi:hypothetical protein
MLLMLVVPIPGEEGWAFFPIKDPDMVQAAIEYVLANPQQPVVSICRRNFTKRAISSEELDQLLAVP